MKSLKYKFTQKMNNLINEYSKMILSIQYLKKKITYCIYMIMIGLLFCNSSCDYLDVVPDNIPTIDHAFHTRAQAQKYMYGLFSFMPDIGNMDGDPGLLGGDEIWTVDTYNNGSPYYIRIAMGEQGTIQPLANYWDSKNSDTNLRGGKALWTAMSDINIFLENIDLPYDLESNERDIWIGQVLFLKAYLHFWLMRMYGPIPIFRESIPVSAETEAIQRYREPIDEVVEYIVELLDQASELLPLTIEDMANEMGLPDRCIAKALKAQVLTYAASPLFNCNPDYADFTDSRKVQFFSQDKSKEKEKWQRAATAIKEAIETAHEGQHGLYDFRTDYSASALLSDSTCLAMNVRGAATERWNKEIIWGNPRTNNHSLLQQMAFPQFIAAHDDGRSGLKSYSPTLQSVERFYTNHGIPIEDDNSWVGRDPMEIKTATAAHKQYISQGHRTISLHFDREPRFYGAIIFDGGTFFGNNRITQDNSSSPSYMFVTQLKKGQTSGFANAIGRSPWTGYLCKKIIHYRSSSPTTSSGYSNYAYAFPIIRLADLYLMYAEALNESKDAPDAEVYEYIDIVRQRSGLEGVVDAWSKFAVADKKSKPLSKEGMRDIIRRERLNEFAFEGVCFWDLRRWKLAEEYMNKPFNGLNFQGTSEEDFYEVTELFKPSFSKKDYFWPISTNVLFSNQYLVQNPGW